MKSHLRSRALIGALCSVIVPLVCAACAVPTASDDEEESEPSGASSEALKSAVSCTEHNVTGYNSGSPYAMTTITVGAKPTAKATAHAFLKLQAAADKAGVSLSITSGFRTQAEQQYLYNCYLNKSCNSGNLAAKPGYSNHQNGRALDLGTGNWTWVANNASRFGFKRTVPSERWHYEFFGADPGGPCSGASAPVSTPTPAPAADDPTDPPAADDPAADNGAAPAASTPAPDSSAGCYSPTTGKTMEVGACVQSSADDVIYQCHGGLWYRGVSNGKGPYGACTSTNY